MQMTSSQQSGIKYANPNVRPHLCVGRMQRLYKNSVRTSQETHYVSATKPNRLMLFGETVAVYCENHTEHISTLSRQNAWSSNGKQAVHIITAVLEKPGRG
jgi:hypothetical protein